MADRLLEPAERQRFARYCVEQAASYHAIAKQMEKLPGMDVVSKPQRRFAEAYGMVAEHLLSVEDVKIGG